MPRRNAENGNFLIRFQNEQMEPIKGIVRNVRQFGCLSGERITGNIGTNITETEGEEQEISTIKNILIKIANESMQGVESDTLQRKSSFRFFYCAKASSSERNEGLEELPLHEGAQHLDGGPWTENKTSISGEQKRNPRQNNHPTVKPLKLMEYLIKLVMPPKDGILLDPFAGSGTTILAAHKVGMKAIGIEKQPEYAEIARARLASAKIKQVDSQLDLFDACE